VCDFEFQRIPLQAALQQIADAAFVFSERLIEVRALPPCRQKSAAADDRRARRFLVEPGLEH
jgi:hypothetical protein